MRTATNITESKRLLSLGIDPETADMCYNGYFDSFPLEILRNNAIKDSRYTPAWSLSALMGLFPETVTSESGLNREALPAITMISSDHWMCEWGFIDNDEYKHVAAQSNTSFFACVSLIEELVKQGYIKTKKV